jgi:multiple sugar transport system ATP-binding protein
VRLSIDAGATKPGDTLTLGIRPEHMIEGGASGLAMSGTVDAVEHLGESSFVYLHLDDGSDIIVRSPGDSPALPGSRRSAAAPDAAIHVFDEAGRALARKR